ncbi:MAG: hypothetical protein QW275_00785 [Candidatus Anstonellaceae archaeon]
MEIKISRTKEGAALSGSLPEEILSAQALELFALKDGIYLLALKGAVDEAAGKRQNAEQSGILEKERQVLKKLLSVKFERRSPAEVAKLLDREEKAVLDGLIKRNLVQVFRGGKYQKEGVYNISDKAFNWAREAPQQQAHTQPSTSLRPSEQLERNGWAVVESESEAKNLALAFQEKIKVGEVSGIRAFDKKYYFVKKDFYQAWEKPAGLCLAKGEKSAEEVAGEIGIPSEGARCLLLHMCETGEVLERRKGWFSRA